jgi:hypothetical protein
MKAVHRTSDVYLASFLHSEGVELLSVRRIGPKTVEVCFAADWRLHELLRIYRSTRPIPVVPVSLFGALRNLKSRSRCRQ